LLFTLGHSALLLLSLFVAGMTQVRYLWGDWGAEVSVSAYLTMTIASFGLILVAISLPEILKLKIGVIELEKANPSTSSQEPLMLTAPRG
jgi:hypothetical protein